MTYLLDNGSNPDAAHVLVIAVGRYDGDELADLPGIRDTVMRLCGWWLDAEPRLIGGRSLGSVRVLATAAGDDWPAEFGEPELPTRAAVGQALKDWIKRTKAGGSGFLFWMGHGGMAGLGNAPLQVLYCCDRDEMEDEFQAGIDWFETLADINAFCGDAQVFCVIDACRNRVLKDRKYRSPIAQGGGSFNLARKAFVLYSARPGETAWSHPDSRPEIGFRGGPMATNAVIEALDRYGADEAFPDGCCAVPHEIRIATKELVRRWARHLADQSDDAPETAIMHDPGHWMDEALLSVPFPASLVDVEPKLPLPLAELRCQIIAADGSDITVRPARCR
jgi:hypothetical protein